MKWTRKNPGVVGSLIQHFLLLRCPTDGTVKYHSSPSVSAQRFSLEAFKFIADHPLVFLHCEVIVCNAANPGSQCAKKCPSGGLKRRAVADHATEVYSLTQGPIKIASKKPEKRHGKGLSLSLVNGNQE